MKKTIILIMFLLPSLYLQAFQFSKLSTVKLSQKKKILAGPTSFFVTEDGLIFVPDLKLSDFKIYTPDGRLLQVFGRKGDGPDEFRLPLFASYHNGRFAFFDSGKRKVYVYKRGGKNGLQFEKSWDYLCTSLGNNVLLKGDVAFIDGYSSDSEGISYCLYSVNMASNEKKRLIPSTYKYGLESMPPKKFSNYYRNNKELAALGNLSYSDRLGDSIYLVWEGILKIVKVDITTGNISTFGHQTKNYIQPKASTALLKALKERNSKAMMAEKMKLNYLKKIFACERFVCLVYVKTIPGDGSLQQIKSQLYFQFYSPDGRFIEEKEFPQLISLEPLFYFDKSKAVIYMMIAREINDGGDIEFKVSGYKIID